MWMKRESEDESASTAHQEKGEMPRYGLECLRGTRGKRIREKVVETKDLMCAVQRSWETRQTKQQHKSGEYGRELAGDKQGVESSATASAEGHRLIRH